MLKRHLERITLAPEGVVGGGGSSPSPSAPSAAPSGGQAGSEGTSGAPDSGAGGGSPSPAANPPEPSPAPTSPEPGTTEGGDGAFPDFGGFNTDEGADDDILPAAAAPASGDPAVPPAQPTPQVPAAEPSAPPPSAEPPAPTPQAPTGQQEPSPPPSPAEPGRIAEQLAANEANLIEHLAAGDFALSKEDLEALEADAPAAVPKLLARTFVRAQVGALRQMQQIVPAMIQGQMRVMRENWKNEQAFYKRWPDIDAVKHGPLVARYAQMYRQANPSAPMSQMIEELGPMVMVAGKITPAPTPVNGAPLAIRPPQPTPFKPAMGGPASPPQPQEVNEWAGMGQDDFPS